MFWGFKRCECRAGFGWIHTSVRLVGDLHTLEHLAYLVGPCKVRQGTSCSKGAELTCPGHHCTDASITHCPTDPLLVHPFAYRVVHATAAHLSPAGLQVMVLLFMWPICNGVLEACERIQASAQQALRARQHGMPRRPPQHAPVMPLWQRFIAWLLRVQQQPSQFQAQQPSMSAMPVGLSCLQQQAEDTSGDGNVSKQQQAQAVQPGQLKSWLRNQGHWALPLLRMLMVQPALLALHSALTQRLPAVLSSRAGGSPGMGSCIRVGHSSCSCAPTLELLSVAVLQQPD